jgi:D-threo-aldose 1-dehydrogenase
MKEKWTEFFETARRGAMIELTRMRKEGLIKAWGMGVNEVEPARRALEVADPDIILLATQYSLMHLPWSQRCLPVRAQANRFDRILLQCALTCPRNSGRLSNGNG